MPKNIMWSMCAPILCFLLASCTPSNIKTVQAVHEPEFRTLLQSLQPLLTANHILDENGAWYSPRVPVGAGGEGAGRVLLDRLSPAFRFPDMPASQLPKNFRAMFTPEARIAVDESSFTVMQGSDRIFAALLALVDWDGDEQEDWLLVCRITPTALPGSSRAYYLLVTDTEAAVLTPRVLGIQDCQNNICQVFDSVGNSPLFQDVPSLDLMPGDASVTAAPSLTTPVSPLEQEQRVREEKLAQ